MKNFEDDKKNFLKANELFLNNKFYEAESIYINLIKQYPEKDSLYYNLGVIYLKVNNFSKGIKVILKYISLIKNPDNKFFYIISLLYEKNNNILTAIRYIKKIVKNDPEKNNFKIAKLYKKIDCINLSNKYLDKCYSLSKNKFYKIYKLFNFPIIYNDKKDYEKKKENFINDLKYLNKENFSISKNLLIDSPTFIHTYNENINKDFYSSIRDFFIKKYDFLKKNYHIKNKIGKKIKLGIISEFLSFHTIGKIFHEMISRLNTNIYEVVIFASINTINSEIKSNLDNKYKSITLPADQDEKIKIIANENLNILFYPDIGMSTDLFYLSYLRLADKQVVSWGHPDTTGNENIDYFLSSKLFEEKKDSSKKNYSEKLVLFNNLPSYFNYPKFVKKNRNFIKNIYSCPQSIYKFHPDFDEILIKILKKDKKSKIILVKDRFSIYKKLKKRIALKDPINSSRIFFLNRGDKNFFISLCSISSVQEQHFLNQWL
jgi:predicted O-linked N-acetylglucosamine transferase (SPINDLY family)